MRVKRYQHGRFDIRSRSTGRISGAAAGGGDLGYGGTTPNPIRCQTGAESVGVRAANWGHPEQRLDILTVGNLADQFLREEL